MKDPILLDRQGDVSVPPGYQVIESEVDFLHHAVDGIPLLIRGERLSAWAEAFFALRGMRYRYQESLSTVLRRVFPALSQEQAARLAMKTGMQSASAGEISAVFILCYLYPTDCALWQGSPSREHAVHWLIWLATHDTDDAETLVLKHLSVAMEQQAAGTPEAPLYQAVGREQAKSLLWRWLGANDGTLTGLDEFPVDLPDALWNEIKTEWTKRLIESKGAYFVEMLSFPLRIVLRQQLASLTAQFFEHNPIHLTHNALRQLQPYLDTRTLVALEKCCRPPEPSSVPEDEARMLEWFQAEYMPFRRWQTHFGDESSREMVVHQAQSFARWYLARYPTWLIEPNWISFQLTAQLASTTQNALSFCVILDGLPAWDAEDFASAISAKIERLHLQHKNYCFAPLPTVTEFAKDALLKGMPPRLAPQYSPLGAVLPDNASPALELNNLQRGNVAFWRIGQPDAAYHFAAPSKRSRQVHAELDAILQALQEVVEGLPTEIPLRIVVTTDHGRLLNPRSERRLPIPDGMQAHGRVAWGHMSNLFDDSGFVVDEDAGRVMVHGERFGMLYDMLIAWGEDSFQNAKAGHDPYPHGGLFPEEIVVPWFVFERDAKRPDLHIMVSGKGEAQSSGKLTIEIVNPGQVELVCLAVELSHGARARGDWNVPALGVTQFAVPLMPWPAKANLAALRATLLFRQPSGRIFSIDVVPSLEVLSLYERDDSLLKELGL